MILLNAPLAVLISHPHVLCLFGESHDVWVVPPDKCFPTCFSGGSPNSSHLSICSKSKTSWFAPSLPPSTFQHKNKHRSPLLPEGMVLGTSTVQLIPLRGVLAALSECGEALSGQRLLFWITCREGGRAEFAAGAWRRDERGYGRESPCLQGGQGWMRVTTRMEAFAKSSLELTMWPVEGQARKEIEVNSVVTYWTGLICARCMWNPGMFEHII